MPSVDQFCFGSAQVETPKVTVMPTSQDCPVTEPRFESFDLASGALLSTEGLGISCLDVKLVRGDKMWYIF